MKKTTFWAFLLSLVTLISCNSNEVHLRLAHYNVGVFHKTAESSIDVIAAMMKEIEADVVSLNELDSCARRTGFVDQLAQMSVLMGDWGSHYVSAMPFQGGAYGIGITYDPSLNLVKKDKVALPKLLGPEPRVLAVTEFEDFVFATCHLDYVSEETQLGQVDVINEYFNTVYADCDKPIFLCGDFNSKPESDPIMKMIQSWTLISETALTYPADAPRKCIDYIFVRPGKTEIKVAESKVYTDFSTGDVRTASDHLPVFVDVVIVKK